MPRNYAKSALSLIGENIMSRQIFALLSLVVSTTCCADAQADAFASIYVNICLKHLSDLDALRSKLKDLPSLPAEKASFFLQGKSGSAWPVPDKSGVFIVAIPDKKNFCAVYARRVSAEAAEQRFIRTTETAPAPLVSRKTGDERRQTPKNGPIRTVSYEWAVPQAPLRMLFTLTTATGEDADLQGLASAAIVK